MAQLKRIGHKITYDGVDDDAKASAAARALTELNLTCLDASELAELFHVSGELPFEANLVEAKLLQEKLASIGFDARVVRDGSSQESPYVVYKRDKRKVVADAGATGLLTFGLIWGAQFILMVLPIPFLSMFAHTFDAYSYVWPIWLLLSAVLAVTEGYFLGALMRIFGYRVRMSLFVGVAMACLRGVCLWDASAGTVALPVLGTLIIGGDMSVRGRDTGWLPDDIKGQARSLLSKPLSYFIWSHVAVGLLTALRSLV